MGDYRISTDSNCDMTKKYYDDHDVLLQPLSYSIDGKEYYEFSKNCLTQKEFYAEMRSGKMPKTAQVNEHEAIKLMFPVLKEGTDILHISFSSALSGTCKSFFTAAEQLRKEFPERKIIVIDSLCASMGQGLLLHLTIKNKKNGMSIEENAEWAENNKGSICHQVTVEDLGHLYRGGRVSRTSAFFGTLLGIKPMLHMNDKGELKVKGKIRGRNSSIEKLAETLQKTAIEPKKQEVFISHGDCEADAKKLAGIITKLCGVKNFLINYIGPVVGSHSGPGTLALFYIGVER